MHDDGNGHFQHKDNRGERYGAAKSSQSGFAAAQKSWKSISRFSQPIIMSSHFWLWQAWASHVTLHTFARTRIGAI